MDGASGEERLSGRWNTTADGEEVLASVHAGLISEIGLGSGRGEEWGRTRSCGTKGRGSSEEEWLGAAENRSINRGHVLIMVLIF